MELCESDYYAALVKLLPEITDEESMFNSKDAL
jgi:hypothetical protein